MDAQKIKTRCCIVGGGPAGMMLGFLLARAGVEVLVLEKHADFLRDFRGDTVHPSTLELISELHLLEEFLKRPHQEIAQLRGQVGGTEIAIADFSHLPTRCRFIALMPQWDFLNFLGDHARRYPAFHLKMQAEVTDLMEENGRVVGVRANTPEGPLDVHADLVMGTDGRHSIVREKAGLKIEDLGAPMDVLWMRLSKRSEDSTLALGRFEAGKILVTLDRGDYWQCAYVIPKGGFEDLQKRGLASLREEIVQIVPFMRERISELRDWKDIKLLTVRVDRLNQWYRPGLLCIGDAAHAMSPVGGIGINLAIQDAVAAANILAAPLKGEGPVRLEELQKVQDRRKGPTILTQKLQLFIQNNIIYKALTSRRPLSPPFIMRLLNRWSFLQRIPARIVGMGFRPEHVKTPEQNSSRSSSPK